MGNTKKHFFAILNKNKPKALCTLSINALKTVQTVSHMLLHPLMWFGNQLSRQVMLLKSPAHHIWTLADQPQNPAQFCLTLTCIL